MIAGIMKNIGHLVTYETERNSFHLSVLNSKPSLLVRKSQGDSASQGPGGLENAPSSGNGISQKAKITIKEHRTQPPRGLQWPT